MPLPTASHFSGLYCFSQPAIKSCELLQGGFCPPCTSIPNPCPSAWSTRSPSWPPFFILPTPFPGHPLRPMSLEVLFQVPYVPLATGSWWLSLTPVPQLGSQAALQAVPLPAPSPKHLLARPSLHICSGLMGLSSVPTPSRLHSPVSAATRLETRSHVSQNLPYPRS